MISGIEVPKWRQRCLVPQVTLILDYSQELPWVRIDKAYRFETDEGSASLADLYYFSAKVF
jgi:predicted dithiol-disulfide oxidoreductase (DUF899 family)